jgi:hypothetical protein
MQHPCNMKIVPFKGVLWLLGGARRQLHGKRRFRVLWLLVGGALVMHAKKGRISTSTAETLIVLLQLLVYTLCNFKGNEIHIRYMLQIHLLFFLDFFSFGFAFLTCNHHGRCFILFSRWIWKCQFILCNCFFCKYISSSPYISRCLSLQVLCKWTREQLFNWDIGFSKFEGFFFFFQALVFWKVHWKESIMQICFNIFLFSYMF